MNAAQALRDPVIRHLPMALHTPSMQILLQRHLFVEPGWRIRHCQIERIKYKREKNCLVCYRLRVEHPGECRMELLVSCRFYEAGGSRERHLKALRAPLPETGITHALLHLPAVDCVAWIFPNDRKLFALPMLSDAGMLADVIVPRIIPPQSGWRIGRVHVERMHYLPEHSCCVRAEICRAHRQHGEHREVWYGKTYHDRQGQHAMQAMEQLWHGIARREGRLSVPRPVAYLAEFHMLWQTEVAGRPLLDLLHEKETFDMRMRHVGETLAALHHSALRLDAPPDVPSNIEQLRETQTLLQRLSPAGGRRLAPLVERLIAMHPGLPPAAIATLHGDLHLKNLLADGSRISLIDLDDVHLGDPLDDLGGLIASLLYLPVLDRLSTGRAEHAIRRILAAYQRATARPLDTTALRWHVSTMLITQRIKRGITRLKADRLALLPLLFALAESSAPGGPRPGWLPDAPSGASDTSPAVTEEARHD